MSMQQQGQPQSKPQGLRDRAYELGTMAQGPEARLPGQSQGASVQHDEMQPSDRVSAIGMAHDLGNLLQIVMSAVWLIDRRLDPLTRAGLRPLVQGALASVDRAAALSRQIRDQSSSKLALAESTTFDGTVREIAELIRIVAGPDIDVEFELRDDVPPFLGNATELENVILNLVVNARDAMPTGGELKLSVYSDVPTVEADKTPCAKGLHAVLRVSDTGCGMSSEVATQVFKPFFTTKESGKGSGIGLATVSSFARRFGGSAEVESTLGKGTAVTLRMPCHAATSV